MDALHILVGFALFVLTALLSKRNLAGWLPWITTLMLAIVNEFYDLAVERWPTPATQLGEAAKDVVLTMAIPTLVMLLAQSRPGLFGSCARTLANHQVPDGAEVLVAVSTSTRLEDER